MKKILILLLLFVLVLILFLWQQKQQPADIQNINGKADIGGSFAGLIDQDGHKIGKDDFKGKYMLVFFGFTHCSNICPASLTVMSEVMGLLPKADKVTLVFVTIDPQRDDSTHIKDYLASFNNSFIGLTGSFKQIDNLARSYHLYYAKDNGSEREYDINHSGYIYLMDKKGEYLKHFNYNNSAGEIADFIKTLDTVS